MKDRNRTVTTVIIIISFVVVVLSALGPFFDVGFTTIDDLEYYLTRLQDFDYWLWDANIYAQSAGRFYFALIKPFYLVPYLFDNFYYTRIVQYLFLLLSYGIFSYFIYKVIKSRNLSLITFVLLIAWTQISYNHNTPTIAYPFYFTFSFSLCLCSILLFIKYTESNRYGYAIGGAVLFLFTLLFYETYLLFLLLFCFYILVRNWKKFGFKKLWSEKIFYKEALPFVIVGLLYVIAYFTYRAVLTNTQNIDAFYDGSTFASNFSLEHFWIILKRCTQAALPIRMYLYHKGDIPVNTLLIGGHYNSVWFVLTHAKPVVYVCAIVVSSLFVMLIGKAKDLSFKQMTIGIAISVFVAFFSHTLIGLAEKYNAEWYRYSWFQGYVTTYYSIFGITLAIVLCMCFVLKLSARFKNQIFYYITTALFTGLIFVTCTVTGYSNDNLSREWKRSQNRFHVLDNMIDQGYFDQLDDAIIFTPTMRYTTQWGDAIIKPDGDDFEKYINIKAKKQFRCTQNAEELRDLMAANPDMDVYYFQTEETVKNCEMMLSVSNLGKAGSLDSTAVSSPVAVASDIFYYSPTKDYVLMMNSLVDGSIILNHRDTVNVCKGLNSLTVTNANRNKRLTRLSISSGMLQADGFFISNMKHATADTVVCY